MKNDTKTILELASNWITRNGNRRSLITLTRGEYSPDHKKLHIFYTVIPDSQQSPAHQFLTRNADEIRDFVKKSMRREPAWFRFEFDAGEKNRERVSDLLDNTTDTHGIIPDVLHK